MRACTYSTFEGLFRWDGNESRDTTCYISKYSSICCLPSYVDSTIYLIYEYSVHALCELKGHATARKVCCHVDLATVEHKHDLSDS
jgi:hypothetical protein